MSTELAATQPRQSALALMAGKLSVDPQKLLATLKATVFKNATDEELLALVVVSNTYGLNPLLKEIYAFPGKSGGIQPIVSIDGWIRMTNDHPQFDGMELEVSFADGKPDFATCKIFRKDRTRPTVVTEYFSECFRNTDPWRQFPSRMLRHKALCQCARVAFGFSGVQDEDEARDVTERNITPPPTMTAGPAIEASKAETAPEAPAPATGPQEQQPAPPKHDPKEALELLQRITGECKAFGITPPKVVPTLKQRGLYPDGEKWTTLSADALRAILEVLPAILADLKDQATEGGAE